jgi:hypothetical protein
MAHDTAQQRHRIRQEIDALLQALDERRAAPRRPSASIVAAYRKQIERHYATLERMSGERAVESS